MNGSARDWRAAMLRTALRGCEPFYCTAVALRNRLVDAGIREVHRLVVPVVSIGNITTGGTGKTPMVGWLAERLRRAGRRPAILSRGYRARGGEMGDELTMLDRQLNQGTQPPIPVRANSDRVAAGRALLGEHPEVDFVLLDDGFQHRRIARDLDIVLISAANPFGFDHVLPRGLLREPLSGLRRAGAIVITHADQRPPQDLEEIENRIHRYAPAAPIYRASHRQFALRENDLDHPMEELAGRKYCLVGGIANPESFSRQLERYGPPVGQMWFSDHHAYTTDDLQSVEHVARTAGAQILVTTEKDWVKIEPLSTRLHLAVWRVQMRMAFADDYEERLLGQVLGLSSKL